MIIIFDCSVMIINYNVKVFSSSGFGFSFGFDVLYYLDRFGFKVSIGYIIRFLKFSFYF